jgi:hypothetical protein
MKNKLQVKIITILTFILLFNAVVGNNVINFNRVKIGNHLIINNRRFRKNTKIDFMTVNLMRFCYYYNINFTYTINHNLKIITFKRPFFVLPYINDTILSVYDLPVTWKLNRSDFVRLINEGNLPYELQNDHSITNIDRANINMNSLESAFIDPHTFLIKTFKNGELNNVPKNWIFLAKNNSLGFMQTSLSIRDCFVRFYYQGEKLFRIDIQSGND